VSYEIPKEKPSVIAHVDVGVCRFNCDIKAYTIDGKIRCVLESECDCVMEFNRRLHDIDPCSALKMPYCENEIFKIAGEILAHSTCPIPIAIIKCVEVASGMALARDMSITFEK
jgi:hypothetical protein